MRLHCSIGFGSDQASVAESKSDIYTNMAKREKQSAIVEPYQSVCETLDVRATIEVLERALT